MSASTVCVGSGLSCLLVALVGCRPDVPNAVGYLGEGETESTTLGAMDSTGSTSTGPATLDSSEGPATEGASGTTEGVITEGETMEGETTEGETTEGGPECGDDIGEGAEQCDGPDLGGANCESEGFDAGVLGCQPDCAAYDTSGCVMSSCGNAMIDLGEECDDGGESAVCDDDCTLVSCGDLVVNGVAGEACDGLDLGGASCVSEGFSGGSIGCDGECQLDATGCFVCGDGLLGPGEPCDGANLRGGTCESLGFDGGVLACSVGCVYDTDPCYVCGDGVVEPGEQCDGGGESATCNIDCTPAICGDGVLNGTAGEACDAGGQSAVCDIDCTPAMCSDGVPNGAAGEACDDGNGVDDDSCSNACELNACGFDVALLPLFVHPDNNYGEIDFDGDCNLIVSGCFNGNLYSISPAGVVSVLAPFPGINSINGVAYRASDDTTYVATDGPSQLWSVSSGGVASLVMGLPTTINAIEVAPAGFGPYGDQIIGVGTDGSVHAFDPAAGSNAVVGSPGGILSSLVFDPASGLLYVAAYSQGAVFEMDSIGAYSAITAGYSGVDGLAISPAGMLFVADSGAQTVSAIDLGSGAQSVIANPPLDGGYYVAGLLYEAGGHLLMKVQGANIDYVTP